MNYLTRFQGFTLIELLVVIAIIGILASVILTALNDARDSGIEAKIQIELDSLSKRAAAEESLAFTYDIVCGSNGFATSSKILEIFDSIESVGSSVIECNSTTLSYAVSASLSSTTYWCVDSEGAAGRVDSNLGAATTCPTP